MLNSIIKFSLRHKFIVLLFVMGLIGFGIFALLNIPIGAVPDITNNQVQVISTSRDLPTEEVERYLTYPVELELGNLPGVQEIRSISKFGLSVVTVVFDDDMGTYLPRQLISEKLSAIEDAIPKGFGKPTMGPISTGLGEIYQYILDVKPGYEDKYSVTDLRTIQDWIVKRQLSGIQGVVEINTWGGFLKTYDVAVDPIKLKSLGISISDVYKAINENNTVAGGGYIEKGYEAFFIRSEGLAKSKEDLESIVVKMIDNHPIFVRDVAKIGFGSATRFGAITGNGEGEKVLGQIMMLKGADSKKVIDAVIKRVDEIQSTLPEGIFINPFLERSELIGKTTFTIAENLILGFLIVLFVVVLLLGNLRSGLVVASVIPITLLFALSLMYLFGVDANLMSLGAIDFGIIIDGAVIIVEYLAFSISKNHNKIQHLPKQERQLAKDKLVLEGADKMMHSAVFGQIIIIIVFIPILALTGIEGKMFRPMALTFCFALIGAMILCFTYVPVLSSLVLKSSKPSDNSMSTKFVQLIKSVYKPLLKMALQFRKTVATTAVILFLLAILLFSKMGGEFVPTLDEGDFVIQPVLKTGMSLAETVKMTTRIEKILKRFPEVKQVVSRIGAAEVPTDPMSMEESDVIITLKKKSEWQSATSKDDLAEVFKDALLSEIPGIEIEFTQPIEMRFNELISGARADLAIKLFGEDLDILYSKANDIENAIANIEGAADISVEKIDGLPQMTVQYNRVKMAKYGLNIDDLNNVISMGFAGKSAGIIYEGESQFDIVIRYDKTYRNNIEHLKNAWVDLPNGNHMPLSEFAEIKYNTGPAKISRDDTKRRVVIGVNVRGRDLQSIVEEVQSKIESTIDIPPGYYIQYGGQFENLQKATQRLFVAVPIALLLIFILLYFAFSSIKEALLIYTAIPLATIGGILALYLRGMPFSISAGIGFIALFGIAVLNGIVMIENFKSLKIKEFKDLNDLIQSGAVDRLRPVLLTAFAAALGFLPMAISSSAGAEVQRPLATVVIGGLFSATLLTLFVLPVLYSLFNSNKKSMSTNIIKVIIPLIFFLLPSIGQTQNYLSLDEVIAQSKNQNSNIKISELEVNRQQALIGAVKEKNKTEIYYQYDQNNITEDGTTLHVFGAGHSFKMPKVNKTRQQLQEANVILTQKDKDVLLFSLEGNVSLLFDKISYFQNLHSVYKNIDSVYNNYYLKSKRKNEIGESNIIEKLFAQQKLNQVNLNLTDLNIKIRDTYNALFNITQPKNKFAIAYEPYEKVTANLPDINNNPLLALHKAYITKAEKEVEANAANSLPELNLALFNGFEDLNTISFYPGVQAGISIPFSKSQYKSKNTADKIALEISQTTLESQKNKFTRTQQHLIEKLKDIDTQLKAYDLQVGQTQNELELAAQKAFDKGEIEYFQYFSILESSFELQIRRLELLHFYNQTAISLQYLLN